MSQLISCCLFVIILRQFCGYLIGSSVSMHGHKFYICLEAVYAVSAHNYLSKELRNWILLSDPTIAHNDNTVG